MPQGCKVSDDLCWAIVRMAPILSIEDIEAFTSISQRQIHRILSRWRSTGEIKAQRDLQVRGRHRQLTIEEVAVSIIAAVFFICP